MPWYWFPSESSLPAEYGHLDARVVRSVPEQLPAERVLARLADFAQRRMLERTAALIDGVEGKPAADPVAQRPAHESFNEPGRIVADPEVQSAFEFLRRLVREEIDRTAVELRP